MDKIPKCGKCDDRDCNICNISNEMLLKEISILWNNTDRRSQLINIINSYFGELRGKKIIDAIKRIN